MTRTDFIALAESGKIFNVKFVKVDGTHRSINGRLGVKKHLKGGTKSYSDEEHNIVTIFDMNNQGYKSIKVDSILAISVEGKTIYERK